MCLTSALATFRERSSIKYWFDCLDSYSSLCVGNAPAGIWEKKSEKYTETIKYFRSSLESQTVVEK